MPSEACVVFHPHLTSLPEAEPMVWGHAQSCHSLPAFSQVVRTSRSHEVSPFPLGSPPLSSPGSHSDYLKTCFKRFTGFLVQQKEFPAPQGGLCGLHGLALLSFRLPPAPSSPSPPFSPWLTRFQAHRPSVMAWASEPPSSFGTAHPTNATTPEGSLLTP